MSNKLQKQYVAVAAKGWKDDVPLCQGRSRRPQTPPGRRTSLPALPPPGPHRTRRTGAHVGYHGHLHGKQKIRFSNEAIYSITNNDIKIFFNCV